MTDFARTTPAPADLARADLARADLTRADLARAELVATPGELSGCAAGLAIVVPALAGFAPPEREIVAMLPVLDINRALIDAAAAFADAPGERACAGIFAVDPFLVVDDLVAALRAGRFAAVVNYPSVGVLDGPSGAGLAAVGYGLPAELKLFERLEGEGFAVHACVTDAKAARLALAAGVRRLLFHAAFRGPAEARAALAAVRAAGEEAGARQGPMHGARQGARAGARQGARMTEAGLVIHMMGMPAEAGLQPGEGAC